MWERGCELFDFEEERPIFELQTASTVPQRVKDHAQMGCLNGLSLVIGKMVSHFRYDREIYCKPRILKP